MDVKRSLVKTIVLAFAAAAVIIAASVAWFSTGTLMAGVRGIIPPIEGDGAAFAFSFEVYDEASSSWVAAPTSAEGYIDTGMMIPGKEFRYRVRVQTNAAAALTMKLTDFSVPQGSTTVSFTDSRSVTGQIPKIAEAVNVIIANHASGTAFTAAAFDGAMTEKIVFNGAGNPEAILISNLPLAASTTYYFEYAVEICKTNNTNNTENAAYMGEAMTAKIQLVTQ